MYVSCLYFQLLEVFYIWVYTLNFFNISEDLYVFPEESTHSCAINKSNKSNCMHIYCIFNSFSVKPLFSYTK